jgi:hypothetical protein
LWASSTSTKNPAYPDTRYVDHLIGPDTVKTLRETTIAAFTDHGTPARTIDTDVDEAAEVMDRLATPASTWTTSDGRRKNRASPASTPPPSKWSPRWKPRSTSSAATDLGRAGRISEPVDQRGQAPKCVGPVVRSGCVASPSAATPRPIPNPA